MTIIPAIDLKDGKAVRLYKGEMESAKIYGEPVEFAKMFGGFGAEWLHIVDLNGAFAGVPKNLEAIEAIRRSCNLKIELGGGIRDEATIKKYVDLGLTRLILGSIALENPQFAKEMAEIYPIAIGIDAKNGMVATQGWAKGGKTSAIELAKEFRGSKIKAIICTDIAKDGTLEGINVDFSEAIAKASGIQTIASGGFASSADLEALRKSQKISGVIVGKAFYEGKIDLGEIFRTFGK
ncbi:1-(5-phosphoribosyl)-5-[(5-phosphoribosylamino)methylideneamino]imidazole-4-carboxamide isomerase [Helicobacter sp. 16-1353]|uniref:1-(5-phosphoribosyl)-5-[(5- phosphoribosylamino)methylideneamino]imidazole-4- carboxamide isomerase n=1 Tax=Helicobacter sp. 16-1353 TaxID=2004996 RepID=UPI000DCEA8B8|nr:1-(5-phosphoribosyl)-5-[(5-phosphoribosylamino)methylideneamino]imidazole-4-carboxamide isomerase [Helicobacter sp. 16-1353]RAX51647.1 1-(5-phosphoribosyl)-5-[(5-phosphoribosylamino)methylideneamino]imidazole-4-carboxamide isomerase [Helicobacter sp. 16-1353]